VCRVEEPLSHRADWPRLLSARGSCQSRGQYILSPNCHLSFSSQSVAIPPPPSTAAIEAMGAEYKYHEVGSDGGSPTADEETRFPTDLPETEGSSRHRRIRDVVRSYWWIVDLIGLLVIVVLAVELHKSRSTQRRTTDDITGFTPKCRLSKLLRTRHLLTVVLQLTRKSSRSNRIQSTFLKTPTNGSMPKFRTLGLSWFPLVWDTS
jgi:hypothetical protein